MKTNPGAKLQTGVVRTQGLGLFRSMLRIRSVGETIARRYAEQEMRCPVHLAVGQEGVAAGVCAPLHPDDQIVSTHRNQAHYLAKGGDLKAMLAELYGKAAGCCGGRGGSMHLFDPQAGVLASLPIVSSSIPIGVGAALAIKQRGGNQVAVVFLGDGSLEEGVFHESANFASLHNLPVVFVCENNLFSVYTPLSQRQPNRPMESIGPAHGMPAERRDGNNVFTVFERTQAAVTRARAGKGPTLLIFDTYRWREHCGPNYDNDIGYRSEEEFNQWKARCPVEHGFERLRDAGLLNESQRQALQEELDGEIDKAFAFAKATPFPDMSTVEQWLYA